MRPTLYGNRHAISAGHYLAAAAGFAILEAGGNAIDAGCCAGMALAVLHPDEVNFAGVAPIMIRSGSGRIVTIAGLGHWPKSLPADIFMREHGGNLPYGVRRTVVPAAPDAWITALRDFGTMTFGDVAAAAIEFARDGFSVFPFLAEEFEKHAEDYARWPENAKIFLPNGRAPRLGERFVQSDLAHTIQYMVDEEQSAAKRGRVAGLEAARAAFYVGDIAERIVAHQQSEGGFLSRDDLAHFRSRYEPPVRARWRNMEVITCGPWCQGPTLIQSLLMMEKAGLGDLSHNGADYLHLLVEVVKCVFSDREHHYRDPQFAEVPLQRLHSDEHLAARLKQIDPRQAMPDMPPPLFGNSLTTPDPSDGLPVRDPDTSYLCVVDKWGNAFSATPSDASWRSPVVPGLGIVPSARGTQSRPDPRHPSGVGPGRRPRLTPNPAIAVRDDGAVIPFGGPGGDAQVQSMLQVFLNIFHFGMDVQEAIDAPRIRSYSFPSSFSPYNHFPGLVGCESRIPEAVLAELAARGHRIEKYGDYTRIMASIELILAEPFPGFLRAGADPRQPAYAMTR
ncbi:gamma-glutamyltransferase family protein [Rhodoligotrophos ferricapiens]|uniref:gamma-glutamyltransferase family protein n=1 Tax=Rhodoligotrophos ferricapiens TaxID=3069264 RepID=UPI00315D7DEA